MDPSYPNGNRPAGAAYNEGVMKRALLIGAILLAVSTPASADIIDRIEKTETLEKLDAIAKKAEKYIRTGQKGYQRLKALVTAYDRLKAPSKAAALINRHRDKYPVPWQEVILEIGARSLARHGKLDEALKMANVRLGLAEGEKSLYLAHRLLGEIYEAKKEWKTALEHYLVPPPGMKCGTCEDAVIPLWKLRIARCRFHTGDVDGALADLWSLMTRDERDGGPFTSAGQEFCEYAARSGKLEYARKKIATLAAEQKGRIDEWLAVATAFAAEDPKKMLAVIENPKQWHPIDSQWLAPLFLDLGEPGVAALIEGIRRGSDPALVVATDTKNEKLLKAIEKRRDEVEERRWRERLDWAAGRIRKNIAE
jgi:tetratricopeptide (TPR) repeat protein